MQIQPSSSVPEPSDAACCHEFYYTIISAGRKLVWGFRCLHCKVIKNG